MKQVYTRSLSETQQLGQSIAKALQPGLVVALIGELGAGKTHLVQAIAQELGIDQEEVNSPTYVLIQEYDAKIPICHIDAYRLADIDEFLELGADELLGADNVCLIEWADRVADVLPKDHLTIKLNATGETDREIEITASGPLSEQVLSAIDFNQ